MGRDDVSRRGVMKGIGMVTGANLVGRGAASSTEPSNQAGAGGHSAVETAPRTWPQPGGTATKTGYRRGAKGPKSSVAFRWQYEAAARISGVVVTDSTVYASDRTSLIALAAEDGAERWRMADSDLTSVSTPAVAETLVYVGCTQQGSHGRASARRSSVVALEAATGTEVWRFEPDRQAAAFCAPTVAGDIVYIIGRNFGAGTVGRLYALDSATGALLWTHETGRSGINGYEAPPVAVENETVYLAGDELAALEATTGDVRWAVDAGVTYRATGQNTPAVGDDYIYVGHGTETATTVEARRRTDGARVWTHTVQPSHQISAGQLNAQTGVWTGAAVDDATVYIGFNDRTPQPEGRARVLALAAETGTVQWQRVFNDSRVTVQTPAIADGTLYTGGAALALADGRIRWRLDAPTDDLTNAFAPPAVADETVYVGGTSLRAITGRL
ncbi:outer membrane protein assembly factor BamB family protein [Halocatena marina]|uniref:PQQ-binding-like beta-propeller repeat protein n=1 Tax=Halocatena marina TaxID=2934937 RepID=A0ABD5YMS1_9EURY|nr:PQQ-binding-like beta-propeller repeat protein [Halocatena marina]